MKILLVEDDVMLGTSLLENLRQEGYGAEWLRDGPQARATLRDSKFDLVLLDTVVPAKAEVEQHQDEFAVAEGT
jgi:two-component system OmpR family response regulator